MSVLRAAQTHHVIEPTTLIYDDAKLEGTEPISIGATQEQNLESSQITAINWNYFPALQIQDSFLGFLPRPLGFLPFFALYGNSSGYQDAGKTRGKDGRGCGENCEIRMIESVYLERETREYCQNPIPTSIANWAAGRGR